MIANTVSAPVTITNQPTGLGWALWVVFASLAWLSPVHGEPWTAFYSEALAAAAIVPVAAWAIWSLRTRWQVDAPTIAVLALACVPLAQAACGLYVYGGEALVVTAYLAALAVSVSIARNAQRIAPLRLIDALFAAIALAALASAGLALYQWLGEDWLGLVVHFPLIAGRAYANLGQPNNLATLLCWGIVAVWWGRSRDKLGNPTAVVAVAFLLLGIALTRSRTGWLEVAVLALAALHLRRRHSEGVPVAIVAALLVWFVSLTLGLDALAQWLQGSAPIGLRDQASSGLRPAIWQLALDEISQRPWFGYGWNQGVVAHMGLAAQHPDLHVVISHAHNVLLDLMVWNGMPVALMIIAACVLWVRNEWRACRSLPQRLLLVALAVLLVHALLELPHTYLFFLLPAGVMIGTLGAMRTDGAPLGSVRRAIPAAIVLALSALLVAAMGDYRDIERDLMAARLRAARIHNPNPTQPAAPLFLRYLQTALERLRLEPTRTIPIEDLDALKQTLQRYPSLGGLVRYARAAALRERPIEARWALERACLLYSAHHCEQTLRQWRELAQQEPELARVELPAR